MKSTEFLDEAYISRAHDFIQDVNESKTAEEYKEHLLKTLPQIMGLFANTGKGWMPSREQMLVAVETGYEVMKRTGSVKQAGAAVGNEINALYRAAQKDVAEDAAMNNSHDRIKYGDLILDYKIDGANVDVRAIIGDKQVGYVIFLRDGKLLIPDDLAVDEEYRGRGIAKKMYDWVKSLPQGFRIIRSGIQTTMGKRFWDKNRGEGGNVWEDYKMSPTNHSSLSEAYVGQGVVSNLLRKGYKKLGKGADKVVFLEPGTGLVLIIFGTTRGQSGSATELTNAQKSFKTFYDLTKADPNNEFLPNIIEYAPFMQGGNPYLQIRMERLFEFKGPSVKHWNNILADMADAIEKNIKFDAFWATATEPVSKNIFVWKQIQQIAKQEPMQQIIMHVGEEGLKKLWNTVVMLKKVAKKNGYVLDLHEGNFMLGSDGTPVIADPFFMGWGRST